MFTKQKKNQWTLALGINENQWTHDKDIEFSLEQIAWE